MSRRKGGEPGVAEGGGAGGGGLEVDGGGLQARAHLQRRKSTWAVSVPDLHSPTACAPEATDARDVADRRADCDNAGGGGGWFRPDGNDRRWSPRGGGGSSTATASRLLSPASLFLSFFSL